MLLEAGRAQFAKLEDALKSVGLSTAKYYALSQLAQAREALPLSQLAQGQACVPSNMTTLVDRLEADGLVRRVDDPTDRRSKRAELTELGREKAAAGDEVVAAVESAFAESLGPTERLALEKVLSALK
jgi:MarR family transcriptional regulator, transcriptional regulator for hemolysin